MAKEKTPAKKKTNPVIIVVIVVVVVILLGYLVAVAGSLFFLSKLGSAMKNEGVSYKAGEKTFEFKDKKGNVAVVGTGVTLPADFPKDFPIYPGAKLAAAIKVNKAFSLTYTVPSKTPTEVSAWYATSMQASGWKSSSAAAGSQLQQYEKGVWSALIITADNKGDTYLKITAAYK